MSHKIENIGDAQDYIRALEDTNEDLLTDLGQAVILLQYCLQQFDDFTAQSGKNEEQLKKWINDFINNHE